MADQAVAKKLKVKAEFTVTPGSEMVRYTAERDNLLDTFESIGGVVLANACGPCIGQWERHGADKQEKNSIMTSFNRNFAKRNDGNPNTHGFVASPEITTAFSIAGSLTFNPLKDKLINEKGEEVMLDEPQGIELPVKGFAVEDNGFQAPADNGSHVEVIVRPDSERLQLLSPFEPWDGKDITGLNLLIKVAGKCTTDHISMAGPWLRYRGHLENISKNLMLGAVNAFNGESNKVKNQLTGEYTPIYDAVKNYKDAGHGAVIVGDENYGEGSSREHAAMEPRFMNVRVVLVKSFARIHETNLKKQGVLALTFVDKADYNKVQEEDRIDVLMGDFNPDKPVVVVLHHKDGSREEITAEHSYNENQIEWFKAGSALNLIKKQQS